MQTNLFTKFSLVFLLAVLLLSSCEQEMPSGNLITDTRGEIVSYELAGSYTTQQVDSMILSLNAPELALLSRVHGVDIYNIIYETIDPKGEPIIASGAYVVPNDLTEPKALVAYQHGTVIRKDDVPSRGSQELLIGIIYASNSGVAVSMTDYLGLGDSPGLHPYMHGASEATAGIDMLRASKNLSADIGVTLNDKLLLFGYSQGGHAAMALHKQIQENYADEFTVTASAPMAGPYDMSGYQSAPFTEDLTYSRPFYLPYLLLSYNAAYDLYDSPSDFLASPYDETLPPLFNGEIDGWAITNAMPTIPGDIIKPELKENFKYNYNHPFRQVLRDNDLYDWTPDAPMHICHCTGDTQVFYENALVAYNSFLEKGKTDATLITPNDGDHDDCVLPCLLDALIWFGSYL